MMRLFEWGLMRMREAGRVFNSKIMNNPQKTALEIGTYTLYRRLLDVFIPACFNFTKGNAMRCRLLEWLELLCCCQFLICKKIYGFISQVWLYVS